MCPPLYNGAVEKPLKVPADQFKAVVRALLTAPPLPLADIGKKRKAKPARRKR